VIWARQARIVKRLVPVVGIGYGFVCSMSRRGQRIVRRRAELARRLRPPEKVIDYALRKGLTAL